MITIEISSSLRLRNLPGPLARQFITDNTFRNPKYEQLKRLGKWAGTVNPLIRTYKREGVDLLLPRGFFPGVIGQLKEAGERFEVIDRTVCPEAEFSSPCGELYPFQARALQDLLRYRSGVLEAPTGSGTTVVLLSAIPRLKTNTLIVVHRTELLDQTVERARSWLGIEPGILGAGKETIRPITVAMVQTLVRKDLKESGIADFFGCVLVDECHHTPATTWMKVLQKLPARFKYGFTATAWRKDGLQFLMWRLIGNRTARVTHQEAEEAGKLIWPDVEIVHTDYRYPIQTSDQWTQMITNLVRDPERNRLIEQEVRRRINGNTQALILTDRIQHANTLSRILKDLSLALLTGELSKEDRSQAMKKVRAGAQLTIATTSLLGEGIDVPGWNLLFLACPISGGPRMKQAMGRVTRPAPGKDRSLVVDFVDDGVGMLKAAFSKRQEIYHAA